MKTYIIMYSIVVSLSVLISYGMALIGHPVSVWVWRDILGVM